MSYQNQIRLTLSRAIKLLRYDLVTCSELVTYCHAVAKEGEIKFKLNAFYNLLPLEKLLLSARVSQFRIDNGNPLSPLDGIPVSFKSNVAVSDLPYDSHSSILSGYTTSGYDGHVSKRFLKEGGSILIGLTSMDEFGMGSLGKNINCHLHNNEKILTRNPLYCLGEIYASNRTNKMNKNCLDINWRDRIKSFDIRKYLSKNQLFYYKDNIYSPGGSSSGSAVSVAFGSSIISIATDTGGSIRLPASWCGVVGVKPTFGAISRFGVISYASSLDTIGVFGLSVRCTSIALDQLLNRSEENVMDSTAIYLDPVLKNIHDIRSHLEGLRVGIPQAFSLKECPLIIQQVWKYAAHQLRNAGAIIYTVPCSILSPELIKFSISAYHVLASGEANSNLKRYDGIRYGSSPCDNKKEINVKPFDTTLSKMTSLEAKTSRHRINHLGVEVLQRIMCGSIILSSNFFFSSYELASRLRALLVKQFNIAFRGLNKLDGNTDEFYDGVDLMIVPTALYSPPNLIKYKHFDMKSMLDFHSSVTEELANDAMTVPISLAGLPSVSFPVSLFALFPKDEVKKDIDSFHKSPICNNKALNDITSLYFKYLTINRGDKRLYEQPVIGIQVLGPKMSEYNVMQAVNVLELSHNTPIY